MTTARKLKKLIMIVTGRRNIADIMRGSLTALKRSVSDYPEIAPFLDVEMRVFEGTVSAEKVLDAVPRTHLSPVLIVVDALVLQAGVRSANEGDAAVEFLDWLEKFLPAIPVLVVAASSTDRVERRVLMRNNASLWRLDTSDSRNVLAETLVGLALASQSQPMKRRITIDVGRTWARYHVSNGRYEFVSSAEIAYSEQSTLDKLIDKFETFSPYCSNESAIVDAEWYERAIEHGQKLFNVLIRDTVSPHLLELLKNPPGQADSESPQLDLRFEIDASARDYQKLFKLPFELVNHSDFDGVLCSRIPMARRIRTTGKRDSTVAQPAHVKPLRVLFMDSNICGNVSLKKDKRAELTDSRFFAPLSTTDRELAILDDCAAELGPARMTPPVVVGRASDNVLGAALRNKVRQLLLHGDFDIFHYCGHSITLDDGLTYLIFAGEPDCPLAISIREVADWVREGHCKMMVLSSCEGASVMTAIETMRGGAEGVLGFRWVVDETLCVEYFERFYEAFLKKGRTFCESYRYACSQLQLHENASPAWASAVAVLRD